MLQGKQGFGIDIQFLQQLAVQIHALSALKVELGIVIGGGNLCRGETLAKGGIDRVTADYIGMLATIMNGLALYDILVRQGQATALYSALAIEGIAEKFNNTRAIAQLKAGHVVLFVAGTGNPLCTTDTAASLRAIEIKADLLAKATKVDGIYSQDPLIHEVAQKYHHLTYNEVLNQQLKIMDASAIYLCAEHKLPIIVFDLNQPQGLIQVALGKQPGTLVSMEKVYE
jgi:uridylate kinase